MNLKKSSGKADGACCCGNGCTPGRVTVAVLLFAACALATIDVVMSHVLSNGYIFGTSGGALSILAFAYTLHMFYRNVRKCWGGCCCGH